MHLVKCIVIHSFQPGFLLMHIYIMLFRSRQKCIQACYGAWHIVLFAEVIHFIG